jgi:two-component system response regulator YesN
MNRVLVVEDEEMIRKGIVLTVDWKTLDCEVAGEAANGEEGISAAERLKPDIIITDLKMPKMDGISMLTELRKRGCTSKVIILTAYNSFSYARSALRLGAVDFLLKPCHDGELEEAILRLRELYPEDDASDAAGEAAGGNGAADPGIPGTAGAAGAGKAADALPVPELWDGQGSRYVRRAIAYIREHYSDPDICVSEIAGALGISEGHLSHMFKKETGGTILFWMTRCRIREAIRLLREGSMKTYEVAEAAGYRDIAYFSSTFKRITGHSPSEYLK